ncbi:MULTISPECIES: pitrilysin family protein [Acidobacterium]|uniref:Insulinase family protein n=1 Tax=Acidobacterium capsulatum (strain ATCC 51196 / DSM 11244 / BCRC 80197 / JCM 7670 / NBRC 15755 / NCIMB 13165 / 161) TaxID=240015 RepID=C1F0Y3_ACIC5|nr:MULTISPECIES: pitrilysin family protein [Acidobacterium]ACO34623.1 insulinase family protein [Acidobacterium capsulatum ATCC 51196]
MKISRIVSLVAIAAISASGLHAQTAAQPDVTRATLANGAQVVIIRNTLAPVVTVEANFKVGGNETPAGFPGMAHAQEHMAFRGCAGMSADQTAAIYALLGGDNDADTQQNITQYFATVPAADVDVALQAQAACLKGVDDAQAQWDQERGAIEQEVAQDLSFPVDKFFFRMNELMFAGTPYAHSPLGTKPSFDKTTGAMLKDFYRKWYTPSNMILVVVGDVNPQQTLAKIKSLFGDLPSRPVPSHPAIDIKPFESQTLTIPSNLPYQLGFIAYRMPGTDSPDYAAVQILSDVLSSQRGNLYAMVPQGKALFTQFALAETYRKASVAFGVVGLPASQDTKDAIAEMRSIIAAYAKNGVPADLVEAAKKSELAQAEFQRNSIPGLADVWSNALAAEGRTSPEEDIDAIKKVTVADVNRVARQYLLNASTITATLKPSASGGPVASKGFGGAEKVTAAPTKPVTLPTWAQVQLAKLQVPTKALPVTDTRLPNGIRLIVRTDRTSPTVTVVGEIKHNSKLQTPKGLDGVSDVLDGLYSYGTTSLDRIAFQKALDDIAANESAGYQFSLSVLKQYFSRGVQLLADNELNPALPPQAFAITKMQTARFVAGNLQSPGYRTGRALSTALLPAGDPELRQTAPQTVAKLTLDEVKQYHAETVRPDLTTIVVIGDVTPQQARTVIEKWFGSWKANGPRPKTTLPPVPLNKPSAALVPDAQRVQDAVILAEQLKLNRFSPDYYPLQLGNHVLGGGFYATRLYHDLRQTTGLVYFVGVGMDATRTRASYSIQYGCDPGNVSKARALIVRDLDQMRTQEVSPSELHQAKSLLLRQIPLSEASETAVAEGLLGRAVIGLPLDEPLIAAKKYNALTAAQVRAAFARDLDPNNLVQVVRGPAPK